jgi:hypothetical protein
MGIARAPPILQTERWRKTRLRIFVIDFDNFSYYSIASLDSPLEHPAMVEQGETAPLPGNDNRRFPGSDIAKAHADFVMALAARKPIAIGLDPHPEDFTARALCCEALIERVKVHLTALIEEAAENEPGSAIRDAELAASIDAHLSDLKGDITGTLEQVAEHIRDDRYGGCLRGPFYRRRGP